MFVRFNVSIERCVGDGDGGGGYSGSDNDKDDDGEKICSDWWSVDDSW